MELLVYLLIPSKNNYTKEIFYNFQEHDSRVQLFSSTWKICVKKKRKRAMNNLRHKQNNDAIKPTKNNFRQKHKLGTSKQIGNTEKMVTKIQKKTGVKQNGTRNPSYEIH